MKKYVLSLILVASVCSANTAHAGWFDFNPFSWGQNVIVGFFKSCMPVSKAGLNKAKEDINKHTDEKGKTVLENVTNFFNGLFGDVKEAKKQTDDLNTNLNQFKKNVKDNAEKNKQEFKVIQWNNKKQENYNLNEMIVQLATQKPYLNKKEKFEAGHLLHALRFEKDPEKLEEAYKKASLLVSSALTEKKEEKEKKRAIQLVGIRQRTDQAEEDIESLNNLVIEWETKSKKIKKGTKDINTKINNLQYLIAAEKNNKKTNEQDNALKDIEESIIQIKTNNIFAEKDNKNLNFLNNSPSVEEVD